MGQQMIDKFKEYRVVNSGTAMPTGDKQQPISVKKVPLRELPNETRNSIPKPLTSSPLSKDRGSAAEIRNIIKSPGSSSLIREKAPAADSAKLSITKRMQPDSPSSVSSLQASGTNGVNGHLVYVRRKLESESGKVSINDNVDGVDSTGLRKYSNDGMKDPEVQQELMQEPKTASPLSAHTPLASRTILSEGLSIPGFVGKPVTGLVSTEGLSIPGFVGKPVTGLVSTEPNSMVTIRIPVQGDPQSSRFPYWKERFLGLQMFLKSCDQSSQEDYIQKLRSLSASGRSRHAVELEKRAIQLLLEEGKELHRMKVLNVLGKALPKDNTLLSTQIPSPLRAQFQRDDMMVDAAGLPFLRNV